MSWLTLLATLSAAIAAIASLVSILRNEKIAREQRAADSVKRYTELALQYPELSTDKNKRAEQRHEWFVSFMLIMLQDILQAYRHNEVWKKFAKRQIALFEEDLKQWTDNDLEDYGNGVRDLVKEVKSAKKP